MVTTILKAKEELLILIDELKELRDRFHIVESKQWQSDNITIDRLLIIVDMINEELNNGE